MPTDVARTLREARPGSTGWSRLRLYGGGSRGAELWAAASGQHVIVKRHVGAPLAYFEAVAARIERLRGTGVPAPRTSVALHGGGVLLIHDYLPGRSDPPLTSPLVQDLLEISARGAGLADSSADDWRTLMRTSLTVGLDGYCEHRSLETFGAGSRALLEQVRGVGHDSCIDRLAAQDLVHYDLHPDNVLTVDGCTVSGVIDWDAVRTGERALDLALLAFTSSWRATDTVLDQLWTAFLTSTGHDARTVYMHHAVLRLVDWIIRHGNGPGPERIVALGAWALAITSEGRFVPPRDRM